MFYLKKHLYIALAAVVSFNSFSYGQPNSVDPQKSIAEQPSYSGTNIKNSRLVGNALPTNSGSVDANKWTVETNSEYNEQNKKNIYYTPPKEYSFSVRDEKNPYEEISDIRVEVEPTDKATLKNAFSKMSGALKEIRAVSGQTIKEIRPLGAIGQTMSHFPIEFIGFQAGVGFLALMQMSVKYHENPLAFQEAWKTLTLENGIGAFSFFAFMYASRLSAPIWNRMITSPNIRSYFPMFIGMLASNFAHLYLEPLVPCAKDIVKKIELKKRMEVESGLPESCYKAYDDVVLKQSFLDMAPQIISGLLSMPVSSALTDAFNAVKAAALEGAAAETGEASAKAKLVSSITEEKFVKSMISSLQYLLYVAPGVGKVRFVTQTLSKLWSVGVGAVKFLGVDQLIVHPVVVGAQMLLFSGPSIQDQASEIGSQLLSIKRNGWDRQEILDQGKDYECIGKGTDRCVTGFSAKLQRFHGEMSKWRQMNMSEAQMAHHSWDKKFSKLTAMYEGASNTYSRLIGDITKSLNGNETNYSKVDKFYGIKPSLPAQSKDLLVYENFMDDKLMSASSDAGVIAGEDRTEKARQLHLENWSKGAAKIDEIIAKYKKEKGKTLPFKELNTLAHIASNWNPTELREKVRKVEALKVGKLKGASETLNKICVNQFNNDSSLIKRLQTIAPNDRTENEKTKIDQCLSFWNRKVVEKMLEGARLFGQLVDPAKNSVDSVEKLFDPAIKEVHSLPNELKYVYQQVKSALGKTTTALSFQAPFELSSNSFLNESEKVEKLQNTRLLNASNLIKKAVAEIKEKNKGKVKASQVYLSVSLGHLEKLSDFWALNESEKKRIELLDKVLKNKSIDIKEIPVLKEALPEMNEKAFNQMVKSPDNMDLSSFNRGSSNNKYSYGELIARSRNKILQTRDVRVQEGISYYKKLIDNPKVLSSPEVRELFEKIKDYVGVSQVNASGQAYLSNFELNSFYSKFYDLIDYDKRPGLYKLETPAEYFVYKMICGNDPEIGESLVTKEYFKEDTFDPPRVRVGNNHNMDLFCNPSKAIKATYFNNDLYSKEKGQSNRRMYTDKINVTYTDGTKKVYTGILEYLANNIRESVITKTSTETTNRTGVQTKVSYVDSFNQWWEAHVVPQVDKFFDSYANEYKKVIALLQKSFTLKGSDYQKAVVSSPAYSVRQEARFYLTIINEIFKDFYHDEAEAARKGYSIYDEPTLHQGVPLSRGAIAEAFSQKNSGTSSLVPPSNDYIEPSNDPLSADETADAPEKKKAPVIASFLQKPSMRPKTQWQAPNGFLFQDQFPLTKMAKAPASPEDNNLRSLFDTIYIYSPKEVQRVDDRKAWPFKASARDDIGLGRLMFSALRAFSVVNMDSILNPELVTKDPSSSKVLQQIADYDSKLKDLLVFFGSKYNKLNENVEKERFFRAKLTELEQLLSDLKELTNKYLKNLNPEQRGIIEECFELLSNLNQEMKSYQLFVGLIQSNKKSIDEDDTEAQIFRDVLKEYGF